MASPAWRPQEDGLREICGLLDRQLAPTSADKSIFWQRLQHYSHFPDFNNYLAFIFAHPQGISVEVRQAAGLLLKNNLRSAFNTIPPANQQYIKSELLPCMGASDRQIRSTSGTIISTFVQIGGVAEWPELLHALVKCLDSNDVNHMEGAMDALSKICEDVPQILDSDIPGLSERPINAFIPRFLQLFQSPNATLRKLSLGSVNQFIMLMPKVLFESMDKYLQGLFALANDPAPEVRKLVCAAFIQLIEVRPAFLEPHMRNLIEYMLLVNKDPDEEVALEAFEFWSAYCEAELPPENLREFLPRLIPILLSNMVYADDDESLVEAEEHGSLPDQHQDLKPRFHSSRFHGSEDVEDEDEDIVNVWNLRKCSAAALDFLSNVFGDDILPTLMPIVQANMSATGDEAWKDREAAVLALGGVTGEGSMYPHRSQVILSHIILINLLVTCVEQIGSKNIVSINHCLARLGELASPRGSPIHRLIAYFTEALALRVARVWPQVFHITTPRDLNRVDDDNGTALRLLNQVSPIPKFIYFTSNEILFRVFEGKDRVHIIDFDTKQGLQWPSLFQSLSSRPHPPSHVRITGIGESKQELMETGDRLARFAETFNLPFEFHPVVDRLEDVRLWMLHVKERETVAVNCVFQLHKMLYDTSGRTLRDFLGLIRSTNAEVMVMAEQESAHNEVTLEARLFNSLKYYSAIFDSVDSSLPLESPGRVKIEEMFGREIRNIMACEGRDRLERHEIFGKWQELIEQGGFQCIGIKEREVVQAEMMLKMYGNERYRVVKKEEENGGSCLILSWLDQPLYSVSAWTPVDSAGGSSLYIPRS